MQVSLTTAYRPARLGLAAHIDPAFQEHVDDQVRSLATAAGLARFLKTIHASSTSNAVLGDLVAALSCDRFSDETVEQHNQRLLAQAREVLEGAIECHIDTDASEVA